MKNENNTAATESGPISNDTPQPPIEIKEMNMKDESITEPKPEPVSKDGKRLGRRLIKGAKQMSHAELVSLAADHRIGLAIEEMRCASEYANDYRNSSELQKKQKIIDALVKHILTRDDKKSSREDKVNARSSFEEVCEFSQLFYMDIRDFYFESWRVLNTEEAIEQQFDEYYNLAASDVGYFVRTHIEDGFDYGYDYSDAESKTKAMYLKFNKKVLCNVNDMSEDDITEAIHSSYLEVQNSPIDELEELIEGHTDDEIEVHAELVKKFSKHVEKRVLDELLNYGRNAHMDSIRDYLEVEMEDFLSGSYGDVAFHLFDSYVESF